MSIENLKQIEVVPSNVAEFYSNMLLIESTYYDTIMGFATGYDKETVVWGYVRMSLQSLKELYKVLKEQTEWYKENFEVAIPKDKFTQSKKLNIVDNGATEIYANYAFVDISYYDCLLKFAKIDKAPPFKKIAKNQVHILGSVRTSIQSIFEFTKLIGSHIEEYEKRFGQIPSPPTSPEVVEINNLEH